jgi:hypothetical protein
MMNLKSAFTKHDFQLAYMGMCAVLGVTNTDAAAWLAELTHEAADVVGAAKAMREAMTAGNELEVYPGAVNRGLDYLRPRHEAWTRRVGDRVRE